MGADSIPGPRAGTGRRDGAYQWTALTAEIGVDLAEWVGEYVLVEWIAPAATDLLELLFVDDVSTTIDAATVTSGTPPELAKVANAPQWIEGSGRLQVQVPRGLTILKIKPSVAARVVVRQVEG